MEGPEFVLAIVAMAMGTGIIITVISKGVDLIKAWINRNNPSYDQEKFERLAKTFIKFKKNSERRFQNLEAIVTDEESESASASSSRRRLNEPKHNTIEVDVADSEREQEVQGSGNLKNMLNKKRSR